jgi:hypothetical protein
MRALLDVNILIALLDADHIMHRHALSWLERNFAMAGLPALSPKMASSASCPIPPIQTHTPQPSWPNDCRGLRQS